VPVLAVPLSALLGDNVVEASLHTPWYEGPPLLELLETFDTDDRPTVGGRVHVQRVIRPQGGEFADFRGYAGVLSGGPLAVGDLVEVLPAGVTWTVKALHRAGRAVDRAEVGHALVVELADKVDVSRGDALVAVGAATPAVVTEVIEADICWMIERPLAAGNR